MSLKDELAIIKGGDDKVHVEDIEDWARKHPNSEWHEQLEWNDKVAGRAWRHQQIRMILITRFKDDKNVREVISLTIDRVNGGGYRSMESVIAVPELREVLLRDCANELARVKQKYEDLQEYAAVWDSIAASERKIERRRSRKQQRRGHEHRASA